MTLVGHAQLEQIFDKHAKFGWKEHTWPTRGQDELKKAKRKNMAVS